MKKIKNKTKDKIVLSLVFVLVVIITYFFLNFAVVKVFGKVIEVNEATGTKYIDRGDYIEVVYSDGSSHTIGNEKTEYENNEIGE